MSGFPNPKDIDDVLTKMARIEKLEEEIADLERKVKRLADAREEQNSLWDFVKDTLGKMDLTAPGNYGHLQRMTVFVREVRRQVMIDAEKEE